MLPYQLGGVRVFRLPFCLLSALLFAAATADAATVSSRDFRDGKVRLDLIGEIQEGDVRAIKSAIQAANGSPFFKPVMVPVNVGFGSP